MNPGEQRNGRVGPLSRHWMIQRPQALDARRVFHYVTVVPANLSPEYKAAEAAFRKAREPRERLGWLREMLRAIPKHKGTEHLQADIKARIKDLADELEGARKGVGHGAPALVIRPEGAAQEPEWRQDRKIHNPVATAPRVLRPRYKWGLPWDRVPSGSVTVG